MTIDEAIRLAEAGNVNAMIALAEHYENEGTFGSCESAIEWFEKAAAHDNKYAALKAAANCITCARLLEDNDIDDAAEEMWHRGLSNGMNGFPEADEDMSNFDVAMDIVEECLYYIAVWKYIRRDYEGAIKTLEQIDINGKSIRARILYSECYASSINRMFSDQEREQVKLLVLPVFKQENNYATQEAVGQARHMEQLVFARATKRASWLIDKNLAKMILSIARQALNDESAIDVIDCAMEDF